MTLFAREVMPALRAEFGSDSPRTTYSIT
jgi:hypothetical protein